jgi:hypothetical protein
MYTPSSLLFLIDIKKYLEKEYGKRFKIYKFIECFSEYSSLYHLRKCRNCKCPYLVKVILQNGMPKLIRYCDLNHGGGGRRSVKSGV